MKRLSSKKPNLPPQPVIPVVNKNPGTTSLRPNGIGGTTIYTIFITLLVVTVMVLRLRFIHMPLERDEGEYAYSGQLILNGFIPYMKAYNMKLPGVYYMYALIMALFGKSFTGIHIGLSVMNAGTMVLLFISLRFFFNSRIGLITAGLYGLMAMSISVLGFAAHATHFVVFYLSLSLFFFSKYHQNKSGWLALLTGLMLGISFLMKQQAVYFILFGGIVFLIYEFLEPPVRSPGKVRYAGLFISGVIIPYLLVALVMFATGSFEKFWFWTFQYASTYVSEMTWAQGKTVFNLTFLPIWMEFKWIWVLAATGAIILVSTKYNTKQKIFALSFSLFAFLTTTPGLFFRPHYFVVILPALALMAAIALDHAGRVITKATRVNALGLGLPLVVLFILFMATISNREFLFFIRKSFNPL